MTNTLDKIRHGLIVSCQALKEEPLHSPYIMGKMAKAAVEGGAVGIRANGVKDINEIRKEVCVPIIGIIKEIYDDSDVYITPTIKEVRALVNCGVEIIALDATNRVRPNGICLAEFFKQVKKNFPKQCFMADCSTYEEVQTAIDLGFDIVSSTLVGYTEDSKGVDISFNEFALLKEMNRLAKENDTYFIAEGNIDSPSKLNKCLTFGVDSVVVGSMITRPQLITKKFNACLANEIKFIDMDGVLVDEHAHIQPSVIRKFRNENYSIVINTGRLMPDINYVVEKYNLASPFKIALNGSHIQSRTGQDILKLPINNEIIQPLYDELKANGHLFERLEVNTCDNRYFQTERPKDFPKEFIDTSIVGDYSGQINNLEVMCFLLIFNSKKEVEELVRKLSPKYGSYLSFEFTSHTSLEIFNKRASKGAAINFLKAKGYISTDTYLSAYGDSDNDISMFEQVDTSYAIKGKKHVEAKADKCINELSEGL